MNKGKLVIIFVILLSSFVIGGGYYSFFYSPNKEKELDVFEVAKKDIVLLCQQLHDYEQKVIEEKKVRQEDLEKSIEILKDQGLWDNETFFGKDYKEFLDTAQSTIKNFQLQLDELLKKVEKEKNLESFRKELEKIGEDQKKRINLFTDLAEKIRKEPQPIPFFATWVGLVISATICSLASFFILDFYKKNLHQKRKEKEKKTEEIKKEKPDKDCFETGYIIGVMGLLFIIHFPLQFLIFPLINCLLSLKMSTLREMYKHYFINNFKLLFLCFSFIVVDFLFAHKLCYDFFFGCHNMEKDEGDKKNPDGTDDKKDK